MVSELLYIAPPNLPYIIKRQASIFNFRISYFACFYLSYNSCNVKAILLLSFLDIILHVFY